MADLPRLDLVEARFVLSGFGVPAEMRKRRRALRDAISLLEKVTAQPGYPPDRLDEIRLRMKEAGELFADLTELVEHAEATLREGGLRYDPETGHAEFVQGDKGGRPRRLVTDMIGRRWEIERPLHRDETGDAGDNTQALRERIRDSLQLPLPGIQLDPSPGGLIDNAIRNYNTRKSPRS